MVVKIEKDVKSSYSINVGPTSCKKTLSSRLP